MRTIPAPLQTHIAGDVTSLVTCFELSRRDGKIFRFTTHDEDILVGGQRFVAAAGISPTQLSNKADLSVDNLDFTTIIDDDSLLREELLYGFFDYARIVISLVDWQNPDDGQIVLASGVLGEIGMGDVSFRAEMRSLSQHLQSTHGRMVMIECDVEVFGQGRCGIPKSSFETEYSVETVVSEYTTFTVSTGQATGYYTHGEAMFESGMNEGFPLLVAAHDAGGRIRIATRLPHAIQVGDRVTLIAGCDRQASTCKTKFGNFVNFQGFPHVPGRDSTLETPDAK